MRRAYLIRETGYTYEDLRRTPAAWLEELLDGLSAIAAYEEEQMRRQG